MIDHVEHRSTLKHWTVFFKVHQQWLWFLVKLQGFCSCFSDVPIQGKKTSPKSKIQVNHPVSRPKTSFRAQVEQREIFVKTNDEKILKHLGLFTINYEKILLIRYF